MYRYVSKLRSETVEYPEYQKKYMYYILYMKYIYLNLAGRFMYFLWFQNVGGLNV